MTTAPVTAGKGEAAFRAAEARMWESEGLTPTERFIKLERTGTTARVQETGEGPPVVFIHGASNSGVSWASLVSRLPDFRCIVLDRPGCGLSDPIPTPWGAPADLISFVGELVVDVLDGLAIDKADIVGTSYGGQVVLRSAHAHPDRIKHLVEFGWAFGSPGAKWPLMMRASFLPGLGRIMGSMPANDRIVRSMFKQIGLREAVASGQATPELVSCYTALLRHTKTMRHELAVNDNIMTFRGADAGMVLSDQVLSDIKVPCYFQWGENDPMGGAEAARPFVAKIPGARLDMVSGGHAVWIDDPDRAARAVRSFLRDQ